MELRYWWETALHWWEVWLAAALAVAFPPAGLGIVVERAPGPAKPVLVVLLFAVPLVALVLWWRRTDRWRRQARLLGGPAGVTLVDGDGRRTSIPTGRLRVQHLVMRIPQGEDAVVLTERRFVVLEDVSTGDRWVLAEMAWPVGERFWQELGVEPGTGTTVENGWKGLRGRFPNVRRFGSVDVGYSALGWLGVSFVSTAVVSGLATLLGAHVG